MRFSCSGCVRATKSASACSTRSTTLLLAAAAAFGGLRDELLGELLEAAVIPGDVEQRRHRLVVEVRQLAFEVVGDDAVPLAVEPARAFAQDLGVVDLPELDRAAAGRHPGPDDAALRADVLGRGRDEAQERVPLGRDSDRRSNRISPIEVGVEQRRQFGEGGVGLAADRPSSSSSSGRTVSVTAPSPRSRLAPSATRSSDA